MPKRSHLLEIAILGVLSDQDLHGYELKRRLVDVLGLFSSISYGSMYPALARLEADGAVTASGARPSPVVEPRPPIPLTGSLGGERAALRTLSRTGSSRNSSARPDGRGARGKKVYAITVAGRERLAGFLASVSGDADDDADFTLRLAFARHIPAENRLGLLERRRAYLVGRLARARSSDGSGLDTYARSVVERSTTATENDISWLDTLIRTERSQIP